MAREATRGGGNFQRRDGSAALATLFSPLPEGARIAWLGDSGMGKSTAQRFALYEAQRRGLIVVAHDDTKLEPQIFPSCVRVNVPDLQTRPPTETEDATGAIVFRGDVYRGVTVEVEEVAAFALGLARRRVRVLLVVDELDRACSPGGKQVVSEALRTACTQGRALGLCVSSTTQNPARAPAEILDQATAVVLFRLGPRALNYVDDRLYFDAQMLAVVPQLGRGDFVIHVPGAPWDGAIYRFGRVTR